MKEVKGTLISFVTPGRDGIIFDKNSLLLQVKEGYPYPVTFNYGPFVIGTITFKYTEESLDYTLELHNDDIIKSMDDVGHNIAFNAGEPTITL